MPSRQSKPARSEAESELTRSAWAVLIRRTLEAITALEVIVQKAQCAHLQLGIISQKYHTCPTFLLGHRTASGERVPVPERPIRRLAFAPIENLRLYNAARKRKREAEQATDLATARLRGLIAYRSLIGAQATSDGGAAYFSTPPAPQTDWR